MKNYSYLLLCLTLLACHSKPQGNTRADTIKCKPTATPASGEFDLAKLGLDENILDLMTARGIKREPKDSLDKTIWGYEVFKSSSPKLLRFEGADLSGAKNHLLFHYDEKHKALACYELFLYNRAQTDTLINLLGKADTLIFKRTKLLKGAIELDENGNEVKPDNSERKSFRVWENKTTGLSYFLIETGSGQQLTTELIVLKPSTPFGKDWISTLMLDWYKNAKSEPL